MKNETLIKPIVTTNNSGVQQSDKNTAGKNFREHSEKLPEILLISSYPPRECGIATYTQDLIKALKNKFTSSFKISICALESAHEKHQYKEKIKFILDTDKENSFTELSKSINADAAISMVFIQHEFGFFAEKEKHFQQLINTVNKPLAIVFHTVLPNANDDLKTKVIDIANAVDAIVVMTKNSQKILVDEYHIPLEKITVIAHGTHLVPHTDKNILKEKYGLSGRQILSTFGLLSSGKSIETTLDALPGIVQNNPEVLFLILGKTHPNIVKNEGEQYRNMLEQKVKDLNIEKHVKFVNEFLSLPDLLQYLQLTDVYLFTSKDPNQAVSGTFSYAMSCGCPIVSTPIPHAKEVLENNAGRTIEFGNSAQLSTCVNELLANDNLREELSLNGIHSMAATCWENSALAHGNLFQELSNMPLKLNYKISEINLDHLKRMTTEFGIIQFSKINKPQINSGYTVDDNARALIAFCHHFELTNEESDLKFIGIYLDFLNHCLQENNSFLNYVNEQKEFTDQNDENLEDACGRAIWALGYLLSFGDSLPSEFVEKANNMMNKVLAKATKMHSTRAMAFVIKGLYYRNKKVNIIEDHFIIRELANRLVQMYRHETDQQWQWFENYLTYANSILPEALLCAWLATGKPIYKEIAKTSFDFLLSQTFSEEKINVISNKGWLYKNEEKAIKTNGGEQPIDVAYSIIALHKFYETFKDESYKEKMILAFNWFAGNNHLKQIIYNPCTGGCYDGLEENYINLNQGAESSLSYLMARLTIQELNAKKEVKSEQQRKYLN